MTTVNYGPVETVYEPLTRLEQAAHDLPLAPFPAGGEGADVLGRVRKVEVDLAAYRRGAIEELEDDAEGEHYQLETTYTKNYSFNWPRIFRDVANALDDDEGGADLLDAFMTLVQSGALKFDFRVSRLRDTMRELGIPIHEVEGEVDPYSGDLELPHIGFTRSKYQRVAGRTEA